jgi:hypothetical protein
MKKLLLALLLLLPTSAYAQKTKTALTTEINTNLASGTAITASTLRTTLLDVINSYYDLNGLSSSSCGSNTFVSSFPTLSSVTCTQPAIANISGFGTGVATALGNPLNATGGLVGFSGALGVATGTSLALGGCTIGGNVLCAAGPISITPSLGTAITVNQALSASNNSRGFDIEQTISGIVGNDNYNLINITSDNAAAGNGSFNVGLGAQLIAGGNAFTGNRSALQGTASLQTAVTSTTSGSDLIGVNALGNASVNAGGSSGTAKGQIFGSAAFGLLQPGATFFNAVTGAEYNFAMQAGSSSRIKDGIQIIQHAFDVTDASVLNASVVVSSQTTFGVPFGIAFTDIATTFPVRPSGTILGTPLFFGSYTVENGIDLRGGGNLSISGLAWAAPGGSTIDGAGNFAGASFTATAGMSSSFLAGGSLAGSQLLLIGSTNTSPTADAIIFNTNKINQFTLDHTGGIFALGASGGSKGQGTINALGLYSTTLALGGCTIGSNALCVNGTFAFSAGGSFGGALTGITTASMSDQLTSTLATGTAPFAVASTTNVANLNASSLNGATFASPGAIGGTTSNTGAFTAMIAKGSPPTLSGTCAANTQVGGNTAGTFKANGACVAGTVILTFATTAPNGWVCDTHDMTTPTNLLNQTASTATSVTFTGAMTSLDVVAFKCMAF